MDDEEEIAKSFENTSNDHVIMTKLLHVEDARLRNLSLSVNSVEQMSKWGQMSCRKA